MKTSLSQRGQALRARSRRLAHVSIILLGALTGASSAQERILNFDADAASPAPAEAREAPIRLLSKTARRADFKAAAAWGRSSVVRLNHEDYSALELPGGGTSGEIGEPELPAYGRFIRVPDGAQVRLVIDKVDWKPIHGTFTLAPRQLPPPDKAGAAAPPFVKQAAAYARDADLPEQPVRLADQMRIRRQEVVYVLYTPLVYNPARKSLKAARRVEWHLEFDRDPPRKSAKADGLGQRDFGAILQGTLDARLESAEPAAPGADLATGNGADYLVIVPDAFYANILPLANWKHAKGYKTRVVKLSEISATPTCTNITAYIQNAYNTWNPAPTYVLLVGDSAYIPAWYKTLHSYYGTYAATDLYYTTVDGTDYFPDLFLGRLPCSTAAQCDLMVSKILTVEKTPDPTAAMYQTLLTAGLFADDDANGYEDRLFIETAEAVRDFFVARGYTVPTAYCTGSSVTPRRYNNVGGYGSLLHTNGALYGSSQTYVSSSAGTAAISSAINNGVWLVQHRDHGSQTGGWASPPYGPSTAAALVNANKLPVVMSINCETAWFDGASDSLAEAFVKNPNGGSHCVIGATRVSYSWYNDWFSLGLYECMYTNFFESLSALPYYKPGLAYGDNLAGHGTHIGQVLNFAKLLMYDKEGAGTTTQIEFDILALLGDPEQSPRTAVPQVLAAAHPSRLMAGVPTAFDVSVTAAGNALPGALVALVLDPVEYHTALTDNAGLAHFSFTPAAPASNALMSVTVSHQNGIPYQGNLTIDTSRLTVSVPASAREGDGVLTNQAQVTVFPTPTNSVTVALASSDTSEVTVPPSVVIPLGQTNATFSLTVVDDADLDGTQPAAIQASAAGYASATNVIAVADNESATLQVVLPASASEGAGTVSGELRLNAAPAATVTVDLSSSDTTELQVPASVMIPAGATSAVFPAAVLEDTLIDGAQPATVTAHVPYWVDGTATVTVLDNEPLTLTITLPPTAYESAGVLTNAGTVCLAGTAVTNLPILLSSSDLTELALPVGATVAAGQSCAAFDLVMVDDVAVDGIQTVTVTASAAGFTNGSANISVLDDESPPMPSTPTPLHLATNVLQTADLAWRSGAAAGQTITNEVFFGTNPAPGASELLGTTTGTNWALPLLAPLTTYYWQVVAHRVGVTPGPVWQFTTKGVDHYDWSLVTSPQVVSGPFAVAVTAKDGYGTTVTNFAGPVKLQGLANSSGSASTLVIAELDTDDTDTAEFANASGHDLDISGWQITVYDWNSWPSPGLTFVIPSNTICPAGAVFLLTENTPYPGTFPTFNTGANIYWNNSTTGNPVALLVRDPSGNVVDFVCAVDANPALITSPCAIATNAWTGGAVTANANTSLSYQRIGNVDHQNGADWVLALPSPGQVNSNLTLPFAGGTQIVAITPTNTGAFSNGVWSGNVSVLEPVTNVCLIASDEAGHRGTSTNFDVLLANDLSVTMVDEPDPVGLGAYLTNLITVVNSGPTTATGVTATNYLPPSATFVLATASQGNCTLVGNRVECSLGSLAGGAAAMIAVVTTPSSVTGPITNRVTVGRAEADAYAGNNAATSVTTVLVPSLSIADAAIMEGNSGTTNMVFSVELTPAAALPVSFRFATTDGTALAGSDYVGGSGVMTILAGERSNAVAVTVFGDTNAEPNETFLVNLSNLTNAVFARSQATGTILTDDIGPFFDDFDPIIDLTQWAGFGGVAGSTVLATNYGGCVSSPNSLWFGAPTDRYAVSRSVNATLGGVVDFWLRIAYGTSSNWETADLPGEGIVLEYSINGGTSWVEFGRYDTSNYWAWTHVTADVPLAAQTISTQFRWRQLSNSGTGCDHWALDEVAAYLGPRPPVLVTQPASVAVRPGTNVSLCAAAAGSLPMTYQWRKDGTNLFNGGRISGATTACLTLASVVEADSGQYSVAITNSAGWTVSSNATLLVSRLDHFAWNAIPSPQRTNSPFTVAIQAQDETNGAVTSFNGTVDLAGFTGGARRTNMILGPLIDTVYSSGTYTLGYAFTPTNPLTVTHVRSYSGTKVSVWTDAGVLLISQNVSGTAGIWTETPLGSPVTLPAGSTYRVGFYTGGGTYYYRLDRTNSFPDGSLVDGYYYTSADGFPSTFTSGSKTVFLCDLRYTVGSAAPVAITPTSSGGFVNGQWTGDLAVLQPASNMWLLASECTGHSGKSSPFSVVLENDLAVQMTDQPDPVALGGYLTNLISVGNSGPAVATGVTATNYLPASVTFISANASQGSWLLAGTRVECSLGTLPGSANATVQVIAMPNGTAGTITNRVDIGRTGPDADAANNSAASTTTVLMPSLSIADAAVLEGNSGQSQLVFSVGLLPALPLPVTVSYATGDGSAQSGSDYFPTNGVLNFAAGQTNAVITVAVLGDATSEGNETLFINLTSPSNAVLTRAQAVGTILNDDVPPWVYLRSIVGAPWGSTNNESAMSRVFGTNNWQDLRFETATPAALFSSASQFIFMDGSDYGAVEMQTFLAANLNAMENWVAGGGRLFLNSAPNEGSGMYFGFGTSLLYPGTSTSSAGAALPFHPVFLGPFTPVGTAWTGGSFAHAVVSGTNLLTLITNTANGQVVLAERAFGAGVVLFGGMTTPNFHSPAIEAANLRANILAYAASFASCTNCPPAIVAQSADQTLKPGTNLALYVIASGSAPLGYQWSKDGTNLVNGGRIAGATGPYLAIASAAEADSGGYSVLVTNAFGTATTNIAVVVTPLDHFAWEAIPSPQLVDAPFAGGITARDALNGLVASFNGRVTISSAGTATNTVGTNASTITFPLGAGYHDERSQVIYPAAELGGAGRIAALALDVSTAPGITLSQWTIRMKHTPLLAYTSYLWEGAGWTTVLQTNLTVSATGWVTLPFTTPFDYNGSDSLMVDFSFNNAVYSYNGYCRGTVRTGVRSLYYQTDSGYGDPLTWNGGSSPTPYTSTYTPNLRLVMGGGPPAPVLPTAAWFTNGVWTGPIVVQAPATNLALRAQDAAGHAGWSNPFGVAPSNQPPVILGQPAGQVAAAGASAAFQVRAYGTPPLGYQWRKDGADLAGATASSLVVSNVQLADVGTYSVRVTNLFGAATSSGAWLSLQTYADPFNPGPNSAVYALALQPDGRVVAGGGFSSLGGQTRYYLGRLNADGSLDAAFNPGAGSSVYCAAVQPDGKILAGGSFSTLGGQTRYCLGRLNADGSLDAAFSPNPNGYVYCLARQPDGRILAGGGFTTLGGVSRYYLGQLNADGSLDTTFNPSPSSTVYSVAVQPDGKILVAGTFSTLAGYSRYYLGRLNPNGSLDTAFYPNASSYIYCLAVQPDGKILVGGNFSTLGGQSRSCLGRLNADGSLDTAFNPSPNGAVYSLALQADGAILAGGGFTSMAGQPCYYLGRVKSDGSLDAGCVSGANGSVYALALQADGRILAGGSFTSLGGGSRYYLGRLYNTLPATETLAADASGFAWLRSDASPEIGFATLDVSTNGTAWTSLGLGTRAAGGWRWPGPAAASDATLRAQGWSTGGEYNGSGSLVESMGGPVAIMAQPTSRTNPATTAAMFSVTAGGAPPLTYRWRKDGVNLDDGANISGARTPTLMLSNVFGPNAGAYSVVISNSYGSRTSALAWLTVLDPAITSQPAGRTNDFGTLAVFSVATAGTAPLGYQWRKDGANVSDGGAVSGARTAILAVSPVSGAEAGEYSVVVSNVHGAATSAVALLVVRDPLILTQPFSATANPGQAALFTVYATGTTPLAYQWRRQGAALPGATDSFLALTNVQRADATSYDVLVTNTCGAVTSVLVTLTVNQSTNDLFNPSANGTVSALALQSDGKVLVGGNFTYVAGLARYYLARLNADGSADAAFNPNPNNPVNCLALQSDGKIVVGGSFTSLAGQSCTNLGRLNPDGGLDAAFTPNPSGYVNCLAVQPDGRIVAGGTFTMLGGQSRYYLGRLNADGTADTNFTTTAGNYVYSLALQDDGKILVGGAFTSLGSLSRYFIGRLNDDGSVNTTFNPGANNSVYALAVQPDGQIVVGGIFTVLGGQTCYRLGRLNADGTLDGAFNPNASSSVLSLALQSDGKILAGGAFASLGGQTRNFLGRVNTDGSLDPLFNPGASAQVNALALQADGKILVGGNFTILSGEGRSRLARLNNTDPVTQTLSSIFGGWSIVWMRGGAGPEVWRASFDATVDGTNWVNLGDAERFSGGWQLSGLNLPAGANVRARGFASGGLYNGSSWCLEEIIGPPFIACHPGCQTNCPGGAAAFEVTALGPEPLSYQWCKEGAPLVNGANVSGAQTRALTLSGLSTGDAGAYSAVVSNPWGSVTSLVATLTVQVPRTPPALSAVMASNRFGLYVSGLPGQVVVIEASRNLIFWTPLQTNLITGPPIYFTDPRMHPFPRQFYRARLE